MKVLEKFQNKKVFALYLVGVLLLSAGVSFAYFSANSSVTGGGSVATSTTATIESEGLVADGNISFSNTDIYPGHQAVASIKVTGTGDNTPIIFNVIFNGNNTFKTPINYTIYKVESNIDASYNCEVRQGNIGTSKIYYEECTGNNIGELGTSIGSGTITQGEGKTILKSDEIILTEPDGAVVYYYVVFEYPNEEANQNDDIGSIISGNITIEEGSKYTNPSVMFVGNTTSGNNGWYKSVSLTSNITTQTGNYDVSYCVTTEESCTPNQTASITDNSFTTTLSDNANPQKLCVRITDEYNQVGEGCSEAYSVDGTNPSISITNTSVTTDSISVTVNGSDSHSGIVQYRFSSDNGSSYVDVDTSDSNYTYTFNNLEAGTSYNISVQAVDEAGNVSAEVTEVVKLSRVLYQTITAYRTSTYYHNVLVLKNDGTLWSSSDNGKNWYQNTNISNVIGLASEKTSNNFYNIFAVKEDGTLWQSTNTNDWYIINDVSSVKMVSYASLDYGSSNTTYLYVLKEDGTLWYKTNGAYSNWVQMSNLDDVISIEVVKTSSLYVTFFAVTEDGTLWSSSDNGQNWYQCNINDAVYITSQKQFTNDPYTVDSRYVLYVVKNDGTLWQSSDIANWSEFSDITDVYTVAATSLDYGSNNNLFIYAVKKDGTVWYKTNSIFDNPWVQISGIENILK